VGGERASESVGLTDRTRGLDTAPQAVRALKHGAPGAVLIDGNRVPEGLKGETAQAVVKGDAKCISIAAASIIAKVRPPPFPPALGVQPLHCKSVLWSNMEPACFVSTRGAQL